jgi:hypothetical protein
VSRPRPGVQHHAPPCRWDSAGVRQVSGPSNPGLALTPRSRSKAVLVGAGATALATQPPEEACEFTLDDVLFSTAYFDRRADGSFSQPLGRWSDWLFPPGSFGDEPVAPDGTPVLAMSVSGMLAMKEQFPRLRNGGPWRQKDIADIEILRRLASR